jgi:hypothetical protein
VARIRARAVAISTYRIYGAAMVELAGGLGVVAGVERHFGLAKFFLLSMVMLPKINKQDLPFCTVQIGMYYYPKKAKPIKII